MIRLGEEVGVYKAANLGTESKKLWLWKRCLVSKNSDCVE